MIKSRRLRADMWAQDIAPADGCLGLAFDFVHEVIGAFDRLAACKSLTDEGAQVGLAGAFLFGEELDSCVDDVINGCRRTNAVRQVSP